MNRLCKKRAIRICLLGLAASAVAVTANASGGQVGAGHDERGLILAMHNAERARVGAPPLQWDPDLAAAAAGYARRLAAGAPFVHSSRAERPRQRENLSRGVRGASASHMLGLWTRERRDFMPGRFPYVSRTGQWHDVAHYTQMIWKTTTHVGCGTATGRAGEYMVCRYSPPGNADGRTVP